MRSRIALIAAIAVSIIICTAAVASAVTLTAGSFASGAAHVAKAHVVKAHVVKRERRGATRVGHRAAARSAKPGSSGLVRHLVGEFEWAMLRRHPMTAPAPVGAPSPEAAPLPVAPASQPAVEAVSYTDATSTTTPDWACIRYHESGDNYAEDSGNGYSGAYQFLPSTWNEAVSGAGYPQYANGWAFEAPPAVQNAAALWLYNADGWQPWSTRYVCGL